MTPIAAARTERLLERLRQAAPTLPPARQAAIDLLLDTDPARVPAVAAALQDAATALRGTPEPAFSRHGIDEIFAPLPPVPYVLQALDLCPGAPALFGGYGYSGKTIAAQALALAVASGSDAWGQFTCSAGKVLHVDYEQGRRLTFERYQRLARGMGIDPLTLAGHLSVVALPSVYLNSDGGADIFAREAEGHTLVIVDSLRASVPGIEENSSEIRNHLDTLNRASERTGATFVVIHHARKASQNQTADARQALRGSSGIFDACGSVVLFTAEKGQPTVVSHEKARTSGVTCDDFVLRVSDVNGRDGLVVRVDGAPQDTDPVVARAARSARLLRGKIIQAILRNHPNIKSKNAILERVGGSRTMVFDMIDDMVASGVIYCDDSKAYVVCNNQDNSEDIIGSSTGSVDKMPVERVVPLAPPLRRGAPGNNAWSDNMVPFEARDDYGD